MRKSVFLLSALILFAPAFPQEGSTFPEGKLSGTVINLLTDESISNSRISVYQRDVTYTDANEPVLNSIKNSKLIKIITTDGQGRFETTLRLRTETDYFNLKIESAGMETLYKNIVILSNGGKHTLTIKMTPENPDPVQEERIEEILRDELEKQDFEKMTDYENLRKSIEKQNPGRQDVEDLRADSLPCTFSPIPINVYVSNLHNGYNGSGSGDGFTGYINFDEYVGGVVQAEIGGITFHLQTKKAQAVAARTYSMNRHLKSLPVNVGQAYNDNINAGSMNSSLLTGGQIMLYEETVIDAKYSARCNGDYTQNAYEGTWAPYTNCNTSGNYIPYLVSRPCSGHVNCSQTSETPCCNVIISTSGVSGYIYGHGVGMCQRGIEQWGEIYNLDYCEMLHNYYTGICITNENCGAAYNVLDCSTAIPIACGELFQGVASTDSSRVDHYGCNTWTETGPERIHTLIPPVNGTLTASISNFTGDLDVYILGSCDPSDCLGEVSSSDAFYANAKAGQTYFIVVDADDGSGSAYDLYVDCEPVSDDISINGQAILSSSTVEPGGAIDVQAIQHYIGNSTVLPDISMRFFLSNDCLYDEMDVFMAEQYSIINASNPSETESASFTVPVSTKPGTYYILFFADATDVIQEFTEDNNVVCLQINVESAVAIKVYPNPTTGLIHFESYNAPVIKLEVYNDLGQRVATFEHPENSINISSYPGGMYLLKFVDRDDNPTLVRIIKY